MKPLPWSAGSSDPGSSGKCDSPHQAWHGSSPGLGAAARAKQGMKGGCRCTCQAGHEGSLRFHAAVPLVTPHLDAQGPVTVAASAKLGKVIDLAWVPLPAPIGGGSVVVVAGEDGSLAVVDATQTVEARSLKKRLAAFKNLVGGRWPFPQVAPDMDVHMYTERQATFTLWCTCSALHTGAKGGSSGPEVDVLHARGQ